MANHKQSEKRARQDIKKSLTNKINVSKTKTAIKKVRDAILAGDKALAADTFKAAQGEIAKLAKTGVIKANASARKISRLASALNGAK